MQKKGVQNQPRRCRKKGSPRNQVRREQQEPFAGHGRHQKKEVALPPSLHGFTAASELGKEKPAEPLQLKGEWGKFLGVLERYQCAMTIEGEQGAGKTRLAWMLANALAELGLNVAFLTLETGKKSNVVVGMKEQYVSPKGAQRLFVSDEAPKDFAALAELCGIFDAVIIDSWQMLGLKQEDFDRLRKARPRCVIAALFQRTTGDQLRGGNRPKFDASINIEVYKQPMHSGGPYATCTKNRYAHTGANFYLATQTTQTDED